METFQHFFSRPKFSNDRNSINTKRSRDKMSHSAQASVHLNAGGTFVNWWHYSTKSRRAPRPPMPRLGCRLMQRLASLCTKLDQVAPPRSDLTSYNRYLCQVARPIWTLQNWQKDFLLLLILLVLVSTVSTLRSKVLVPNVWIDISRC